MSPAPRSRSASRPASAPPVLLVGTGVASRAANLRDLLAGVIGIALCVDPKALPDVARLADVIEGAYAELRCAAIGG